jgi:anti-anti-sigma regulatory factor
VQNPTDELDGRFAVLGDRRNGVARLSLLGTLDRDSVVLLESEVDGVAHAGGAVVLDLLILETVDLNAVRALEAMARRATDEGWLLFLVRAPDHVRDEFDRVGALGLLSADVSEVLSEGDGDWESISLPPSPWQRARTPGRRTLRSRP